MSVEEIMVEIEKERVGGGWGERAVRGTEAGGGGRGRGAGWVGVAGVGVERVVGGGGGCGDRSAGWRRCWGRGGGSGHRPKGVRESRGWRAVLAAEGRVVCPAEAGCSWFPSILMFFRPVGWGVTFRREPLCMLNFF